MADISVTLPDGSGRLVADGSTVLDVAASIGSRLAQAAIAGTINGTDVDVSTVVKDGDVVAIVTTNSDQGRHILRHSTAPVLAQAVVQLFPGAHYTIGPAFDDGFYYD
ncbi:MAG: TGS domain-containing protein, partial [Ilumatobacteraceae bacterium]|nr:TGS domain-containing protein [Ilumatobacteraceae bacterium]